MSATDAYGNVLPRGTRRQLAKEHALYRRIGHVLARAVQPDPNDRSPAKEVT